MTTLNRFADIADLVKDWAQRLNDDAGDLSPHIPVLVEEMRAFSNGLRGTVETFRPIIEAAEVLVAANIDQVEQLAGEMLAERNIRLVRVEQTGTVSPSQWNAWDAEGNYYYLRYRYGKGSVWSAKSEEDLDASGNYDVVCEWSYGHSLDGYISLEEFARHSSLELSPALAHSTQDPEDN